MFQNFLLRKMMKAKLKGVPEAEQDKLISIIEKNPELFQKIAEEAKMLTDSGKDQMTAIQEVVSKYQKELGGIL